jgi:hypothetical protein
MSNEQHGPHVPCDVNLAPEINRCSIDQEISTESSPEKSTTEQGKEKENDHLCDDTKT